MSNLRLDPTTHDLVIGNYQFEVVSSKQEEITQRLKIKLLWYKEEWFLDLDFGIPYFQEIFVKGVYKDEIDDIFRVAIRNEDGVLDLISYSSDFNTSTREFVIEAKIRTSDGSLETIAIII